MPDFFQTGSVTTLHQLATHDEPRFSRELSKPGNREVTLLLPCLASDFAAPAMTTIIDTLRSLGYLKHIILALNKAAASDCAMAARAMEGVPGNVHLLWLESPRMQQIQGKIESLGLSIPREGKGRAVWFGFGLANAIDRDQNGVILMHDCDITTYTREMPDRLVYPMSMPDFGYEFAKGYYARVSDRMNGRVVRLFFTPLVRSLERIIGSHPFLQFLDSFRYPLSGECALTTSLSRLVRIPGDWGLEIGFLAEVYRLCAPNRICDVEIASNYYEHKHRPLVDPDGSGGLRRMAREIARTILRTLAMEGITLSDGAFRSLRVAYLRLAQDYIRRYADDARIDGLPYDRHAEGTAVEAFAEALGDAIVDFCNDPLRSSMLPNWNRILSANPDCYDIIQETVQSDRIEFCT